MAETWEQQGPQFRKDVCEGDDYNAGTPNDALVAATLDAYPATFLNDDVRNAVQWFLWSWIPYRSDMTAVQFLFFLQKTLNLDRGRYFNSQLLQLVETENVDETRQKYIDTFNLSDDLAYLGPLDPMPDPCADGDT